MNWAVDNNGAWDYAADTRGYTLGGIIQYIDPLFAVRFGLMLMPKVANGEAYDYDLANARGQNLEVEIHHCLAGFAGKLRVLGFLNDANMGSYAEAIAISRLMLETPDVTATRVKGRTKYGFGISEEQALPGGFTAFGRFGWADGKNEAFAYTEIDNTLELGFDVHVPHGKLGVAGVTNGLSEDHRTYLALGGKGFLLGDGKLRYGREDILEAYYTARAYRGVFPAIDLQLIDHPGYNRDRGPAAVGSLRLHVEI
jgi:carbohydrate-selective porin OprB